MPALPRSGEFALIDRHFRRPPVSRNATVGIGDERTVCVFGTAEGTFRPSADPMEEIESAWYTRAQVRALHETDLFGSWALAYSWMFANGCLPGV